MTSFKRAGLGLVTALLLAGAPQLSALADTARVATVNGQAIARVDYDHLLNQAKAQFAARYGIDFSTTYGHEIESNIKPQVLNQLVERALILDEARVRHVTVSDEQVDAKLGELKRNYPDEAAFAAALVENDVKLDELKVRVHEGLVMQAVVEAIAPVKVLPEDVSKHYQAHQADYRAPEEVRVSHILVKDEAQAKDLLAQLEKGADFAKLAAENSLDPGSKGQGGDLGFFGRGVMVPEFEEAAFAVKKGEIAGPVKTQFGYHLLKGVDHHDARQKPLDEVKDEIAEGLGKEQREAAFGSWLSERVAKAKVEYEPGFEPAKK